MRIKVFLLYIMLCGNISAQHNFINERIDIANVSDIGQCIILFHDNPVLLISYFDPTIRLALTFLDSSGIVIQNKTYGDGWHNHFTGFGGGLIQTSEGGFAYVGSIDDSTGSPGAIIFYKFNSLGDTEWTKNYGNSRFQAGWQTKQTEDGGYIITGTSSETDTMGDVILFKIDNIGNVVWTKYYGGTDNDVGLSVVETADHGFFISGYTFSYGPHAGSTFDNCYAVKTDSLGNMQWQKTFGGQYGESFYMGITTRDSNILAVGLYTNFDPYVHCCAGYAWPYFVKLDLQGNVIWEKKIGVPIEETATTSVRELPNGSFIACGITTDTINWRQTGFIIKLSSQGDSIWYRKYVATPGLHSGSWFYDIVQTNDGGFIATGEIIIASPDTGTGDAWLVKVDSNGCEVYNCLGVGINDFEKANNHFIIYPNPFNHFFTIETDENYSDEKINYVIHDVFGKEIYRSERSEEHKIVIDGSHFSPGVYFVTVFNAREKIITLKIIKSD